MKPLDTIFSDLQIPKGLEAYPLNASGIPLKNFKTHIGWAYEPIVPAYYVNGYLDIYLKTRDDLYIEAAMAMARLIKERAQILHLREYSVHVMWTPVLLPPFVHRPWWCPMTVGRTGEALLRLAKISDCEEWQALGLSFLRAMIVPRELGGSMIELEENVWFEDGVNLQPHHRILNAHGSCLVSLWAWLKEVNNPEIEELLSRGLATFKREAVHYMLPEGQAGSYVRLTGPAWLRLSFKNLESSPAVSAITLQHHEGSHLQIDCTRDYDDGWVMSQDGLSSPSKVVLEQGVLARRVNGVKPKGSMVGAKAYYALLFNIMVTRQRSDGDVLRITANVFVPHSCDVVLEIYPNLDGKYHRCDPVHCDGAGWHDLQVAVPMQTIRVDAPVLNGNHFYHHLNTSYCEFVNDLQPDSSFGMFTSKWRSNSSYASEDNVVRWYSEEKVEERWTPTF